MASELLRVHSACSLLSYAAFLVACVSGGMFLLQERQLKRKTIGVLFHQLPSLDVLDRINVFAIAIGFALLSIGTVCGFVGAGRRFGRWWNGDPKELLTVLLLGSYLTLWLIRVRATVRGRRIAWLSVLGFSLVLMTALGAGWLIHSGHPYL